MTTKALFVRCCLLGHIFFVLVFLAALPHYSYGATGLIEVYSEPSGAKVFIDNNLVGNTPYQNVRISTGHHKIKVFLSEDYPPQFWDVNIDAVTPQTKTFYFKKGAGGTFTGKEMEQTIEKHKGNIQLASIPTGALVLINGVQMKTTPIGYQDADVGRYSVEFKMKGKSLKSHFDIVKDETVKLIADFDNMKIINAWEEEKSEMAIQQENKRKADIRENNKRLFWPFQDNEDGTVTRLPSIGFRDAGTIYMREDFNINAVTWNDANNYCRNLNAYGYSDWRLPSIVELYTMVGSNSEGEKIRWDSLDIVFNNLKNDYYWSSTSNDTMAKIHHMSKYLNRKNANKNDLHYVKCVRGPKVGYWMNFENICKGNCNGDDGWKMHVD